MPREFGNDYDPDRMEGFDSAAPGKCHLEVTHVDENAVSKGSGNPQMIVDFEVLAHSEANQEGKTHREFFPWTAKAENKALQFAVAVGLTTIEELKAIKEAGKNPVIDFNAAVGRQMLGKLVEEEYPKDSGKMTTKLNYNLFHVDSPKHRDYPRNQGKLNELGDAKPDPFLAGGSTSTGPVAGAQGTDLFG